MTRLAILGASGHGKVVADIALQTGWTDVVFFDDAWPQRATVALWPVVGDTASLLAVIADYQGAIAAIGDGAVRAGRLAQLRGAGARLVSLVHPRAAVSRFAEVGLGSVVVANAVVDAFARVGEACIVNTGATIGHDCWLGDAVHVAPGANLGGEVRVGDGSWIGIGAVVRQGVRIGREAIVGAGAVVVRDVDDGVTVMGVPARPRPR